MVSRLTFEQTERKLAAAARYRDMARYMADAETRTALVETAAEFERAACAIRHVKRRAG